VKIFFYPAGTRTPAPPARPARSQSLYRLSYPGSPAHMCSNFKCTNNEVSTECFKFMKKVNGSMKEKLTVYVMLRNWWCHCCSYYSEGLIVSCAYPITVMPFLPPAQKWVPSPLQTWWTEGRRFK
jgi:hypothetical protein